MRPAGTAPEPTSLPRSRAARRRPRPRLGLGLLTALGLLALALSAAGCGDSGVGDGGAAGCRYAQADCSGCIRDVCLEAANACYGEGFTFDQLCDDTGAQAMCTTTGDVNAGLMRQTDFATCVTRKCLSQCGG